MRNVGLVLDAACVVAYAHGSVRVGMSIAKQADRGRFVVVPLLCLAEAYRGVDENGARQLDVLRTLDNVDTPSVEADDALFLGGFAKLVGSLDLAHAALEAATRPIVPIMTAESKLLLHVLAPGWPIIPL